MDSEVAILNRKDLVNEAEDQMHDVNRLLYLDKKKSYYFEDVSMTQLIVLREIIKKDNIKVSDIAHRINVSVPAITNITDKLISQNFIERIRTEEDRRVVRLVPTEKGKDIINRFSEYHSDVMQKVFEGVSDEDIGRVIEVYKKIKENYFIIKEY